MIHGAAACLAVPALQAADAPLCRAGMIQRKSRKD